MGWETDQCYDKLRQIANQREAENITLRNELEMLKRRVEMLELFVGGVEPYFKTLKLLVPKEVTNDPP